MSPEREDDYGHAIEEQHETNGIEALKWNADTIPNEIPD